MHLFHPPLGSTFFCLALYTKRAAGSLAFGLLLVSCDAQASYGRAEASEVLTLLPPPSLPGSLSYSPVSGTSQEVFFSQALSLYSQITAPSPCPFSYRDGNSFPLLPALMYSSILLFFFFSNSEHTFVNSKIFPNDPIESAIYFPQDSDWYKYFPQYHTDRMQLILASKADYPVDSTIATGWYR